MLAPDKPMLSIAKLSTGTGDDLVSLLDCMQAQWAFFFFGLCNYNMCVIHIEQAMSDQLFMYSRDSTDPHSSRTVRYARFLDIAASFFFGSFLLMSAVNLHSKRWSPTEVRKRLQTHMLIMAIAYFLGALADFVQCQYQAGGIGSQCNGYSCLYVASAFAISLAVLILDGRFFLSFCLVLESVYRLHWISKLEKTDAQPYRWSFMVMIWVVVLGFYPLVLHFSHLSRAAKHIFGAALGNMPVKILQFSRSNHFELRSGPSEGVQTLQKYGHKVERVAHHSSSDPSFKPADMA
jgi:hypothetical protein